MCVNPCGENWDANLTTELAEPEPSAEAEVEDDESMDEEPVPKLKKFSEAIMMLKSGGYIEEATTVSSVIE